MTNRNCVRLQADHLYVSESPFGDDVCTYCGDLADTWDHVVPLTIAAALYDQIIADRSAWRHGLKVVPCCHDCNSRLGDHFAKTITEKRKLLAKKLRKKYRRELMTTDWGATELEDLGPNLRQFVITGENQRRHAEQRVRFADSGGRR